MASSSSPRPVNVINIMPASFSLDTILPPKLDINAGAKSHFFQPPKTSAAPDSLHCTTPSLSTQHVNLSTSRKRPRHPSSNSYLSDQATPVETHPYASPTDTSYSPSPLDHSTFSSPVPFVNTRYRLAGGLDTPTACLSMDKEGEHLTSPDLHGRGFGRYQSTPDSYFPQLIYPLSREGNGRPRQHASPRIQYGLGKAVFGMISVAGKVWDFCRTTAFKGFYAGGGQGYEMKPALDDTNCGQSMWQDGDVPQSTFGDMNGVPGCFPEQDFIAEYMSENHTTPPRAAKRIQREKGMSGELSASWVLVSRETSPSRLSRRKIPPSKTSARRPIPKAGGRPVLPASKPSLKSFAGLTGLYSDRSASFASPRSPNRSPIRESPSSTDVQRQAARMRRREMEEDANLKRFNQQLKAMIKEGKEALGTTIEVIEPADENDTGGGYVYTSRTP